MVLQLAVYFGGLVTFAVSFVAFFATKRAWTVPIVLMPMFIFVSVFAADEQNSILWVGAGFSLIGYLIALTIKILVNREKKFGQQ
ncbi:hypothetical protein [Aneurinibacillus terranovensis]|uniref:hypothetical protein n=1 Tax=Aneurinibacillus terranovensis TaxID=278991 RepID=UPI0004168B4D|nr:hypothetical protein [Aneurinibacillus terranovensis]